MRTHKPVVPPHGAFPRVWQGFPARSLRPHKSCLPIFLFHLAVVVTRSSSFYCASVQDVHAPIVLVWIDRSSILNYGESEIINFYKFQKNKIPLFNPLSADEWYTTHGNSDPIESTWDSSTTHAPFRNTLLSNNPKSVSLFICYANTVAELQTHVVLASIVHNSFNRKKNTFGSSF